MKHVQNETTYAEIILAWIGFLILFCGLLGFFQYADCGEYVYTSNSFQDICKVVMHTAEGANQPAYTVFTLENSDLQSIQLFGTVDVKCDRKPNETMQLEERELEMNGGLFKGHKIHKYVLHIHVPSNVITSTPYKFRSGKYTREGDTAVIDSD